MDLTHRFTVPAGLDEAWNAFNDLDGLAPCFPGATVTGIDGDEFTGSVKIKLGPIALVYNGTGRYVRRDIESRTVVIEARGKDKRGNGTATASVTATFAGAGDQTDVEVVTDLAITGKPAQFGRGVISDVSDKLLDQFVTCVSSRFAEGLGSPGPEESTEERAEPTGEPAPVEPAAAPDGEVGGEPGLDEMVELGTPPSDVDADTPAAEPTAPDQSAIPSATPKAAPPPPPTPTAPSAPPPPRKPTYTPPSNLSEPHLNVLTTVVPSLVKRYGPALGGLSLLVVLVVMLVRRLRSS